MGRRRGADRDITSRSAADRARVDEGGATGSRSDATAFTPARRHDRGLPVFGMDVSGLAFMTSGILGVSSRSIHAALSGSFALAGMVLADRIRIIGPATTSTSESSP
jgi:hypothetical protein